MFAEFAVPARGQNYAAVAGAYVGDLLRAVVRLRGIEVGRPVDVVLDRDRRRALGFEIHCRDDERRFLPFAVASISPDTLAVGSSLHLLDRSELRFYTDRGATFASLRHTRVERNGRTLGILTNLRIDEDGRVTALVLTTPRGRLEVPYDDRIVLASGGVRAAS